MERRARRKEEERRWEEMQRLRLAEEARAQRREARDVERLEMSRADAARRAREDERNQSIRAIQELVGPGLDTARNDVFVARTAGRINEAEADKQLRGSYTRAVKAGMDAGFSETLVRQVVGEERDQFAQNRRDMETELRSREKHALQLENERLKAENTRVNTAAALRKAEDERAEAEFVAEGLERQRRAGREVQGVDADGTRAAVVQGYRAERTQALAGLPDDASPEQASGVLEDLEDTWLDRARQSGMKQRQLSRFRDEVQLDTEVYLAETTRVAAEVSQVEAERDLARQATDRLLAGSSAASSAAVGGRSGRRVLDDLVSVQEAWRDSPLGHDAKDRMALLEMVAESRIDHAILSPGDNLTALRRRWEAGEDDVLSHALFRDVPKQFVERHLRDATLRSSAVHTATVKAGQEATARRTEYDAGVERAAVARMADGAFNSKSEATLAVGQQGVGEAVVKKVAAAWDLTRGIQLDLSEDPEALEFVSEVRRAMLNVDSNLIGQTDDPAASPTSLQNSIYEAWLAKRIDTAQYNALSKELLEQVKVRKTESERRLDRDFTSKYIDKVQPGYAVFGTTNEFLSSLGEGSRRQMRLLVTKVGAVMLSDGVYYEGSGEDKVGNALVRMGHSILREQDRARDGVPPGMIAPTFDPPDEVIEESMAYIHARTREEGAFNVEDRSFFPGSGLFDQALSHFAYTPEGVFDYEATLRNLNDVADREGVEAVLNLYVMADHASDLSIALGSFRIKEKAKVMGAAQP